MGIEDRIRNWKSRSKVPDYVVGEGVPLRGRDTASRMEGAAASSPADEEALAGRVLARILQRLSGIPDANPAERRRIYAAEQADLERGNARLPSEVRDFRLRTVRTIVRLLEEDIRSGFDVYAAGYEPAGLEQARRQQLNALAQRRRRRAVEQAREARREATRRDQPLAVDLPRAEAADLAVLRMRLDGLHAGQHGGQLRSGRSPFVVLAALIVLQLHLIQGESRIALIWALFGPAVLLSLISMMYFLTGTHYILGMDVPTFSLLGATTWIMFRQIIFRTSTGYVSARGLLNLQDVSPLAVALSQSAVYLMIYVVVYAVLLSAGHALDLITLPVAWAGFIFYVVMMGAAGATVGVLFGAIATRWRFYLRLAPVIERFVEVCSSVFFVSEQLPEQYRKYLLWSPFAHGMQLLRSAYFASYTSQDASRAYFLVSLVFMAVLAAAAERLVRRDVQPM
ncbi:ABC transporter permease [Candidimonas nitroreducens]|uniref:Sugar ABC transporter permease n=1 Tax=Candidimonas nitroreducens TaxID=683354 RepID=A0A225MH09_9BURK|nr:sugar ABC transporter permease [Candidimonas nitroreducens]OWT60564.1 sugar ABC transporter permease [Candidimonas nitroreducens]